MLDQSFSADNFRRIFDLENRKGVYLEGRFFPKIKLITEEIRKCDDEIRKEKRSKIVNELILKELEEKKTTLKSNREEQLTLALELISQKIVAKDFQIRINKNDSFGNKAVYVVENSPDQYFTMKQVQRNVALLFGVKQSNRFAIVSQMKGVLGDGFPKFVIRTDLKDFYESLPHTRLLQRINEDSLLSSFSKKIIRRILESYKNQSGNDKGVPRGIGISAYLAELYMKEIDRALRNLSDVTYYARYVDDIIMVFTPRPVDKIRNYLDDVKKIVEIDHELVLNVNKTTTFDLISQNGGYTLEYLGYKFIFRGAGIKIKLSSSKINRYKKRIDFAINAYTRSNTANEKKARKLLIQRLRFLTGNTRLANNKKNIFIGIYYSNSHLTDLSDLNGLDSYLSAKINQMITNPLLELRLEKYKFKEGFEKRRFSAFTAKQLSSIMTIWRRIV